LIFGKLTSLFSNYLKSLVFLGGSGPRFRRQRAGEGNEIGPRQQCVCGNCRRRPDIRLLLADVLISGVTSISVARLSEDAYRQVKSRLDLAVNDLDST
jgi:hypothetical protein